MSTGVMRRIDRRFRPEASLSSPSCRRRLENRPSREMRFRAVAALPLLPQEFEEEPDRFLLPLKMMDQSLAPGTDAAPSADEASFAEQVGLDRHGIVAGHVFAGVRAFDVELVGLRDHELQNRTGMTLRPTTYLNRSLSTDSRR